MRRKLRPGPGEARRRLVLLAVGNATVVAFAIWVPQGISGLATFVSAVLSCAVFTFFVELGLRRARHRSEGAPRI
jgi:hypothetical protein